jgi:molybdopterin-guanine dinucleotide biosynthesis protein A
MDELAAVILVGGKSSRMGQDKASLPYKGKRLVDVVADSIRSASVSRIYVSGKIADYPSFPDLLSECGPVSGICSCILRLSINYKRLLFVPVDMPYLTADLIRLLIDCPARKPHHIEGHPLPCIVSTNETVIRHADKCIQELVKKRKLSVKEFLAALNAISVPLPEQMEKALTNTNTPEEWQEATHESTHQ